MSKKKWYGGRAVLNKPGFQSTAAIVAEVQNTKGLGEDRWTRPAYTLQFANCDRSIAFDMEFHDSESRANNLHKVRTMIKYLQEFERGLVKENKRMDKREKVD